MTDFKHWKKRRQRRELPEPKARERASHLKRKFGLTLAEHDGMLASQGGRCAICRRKPRKASLRVDDPQTQKLVALARARVLALRS